MTNPVRDATRTGPDYGRLVEESAWTNGRKTWAASSAVIR